jgi:prepilin-type N-terminal cleavage/methylation domain-containing protein
MGNPAAMGIMPISRAGRTPNKTRGCSGVTLIELVLVMTLIALLAAVTYPTASAGLDSLRLRTAAERVVSLLNSALDRADRVQQVIEIRISPEDNSISARSSDLSLNRTLEMPVPVRISSAGPELPNGSPAGGLRRYLLYPGGTPPHINIELETAEGRRRRVSVDPLTGTLHSELETAQ